MKGQLSLSDPRHNATQHSIAYTGKGTLSSALHLDSQKLLAFREHCFLAKQQSSIHRRKATHLTQTINNLRQHVFPNLSLLPITLPVAFLRLVGGRPTGDRQHSLTYGAEAFIPRGLG